MRTWASGWLVRRLTSAVSEVAARAGGAGLTRLFGAAGGGFLKRCGEDKLLPRRGHRGVVGRRPSDRVG